MEEYRVQIPEEDFSVITFRQDDIPGVGVINASLSGFEPKVVFAWHLSLLIEFEDLIENGMPSQAERDVVDPFCDRLDAIVKGDHNEKPNALFLGRITWNEARELIWRVHDPEIANNALKEIIETERYPRMFDYRMEHDPDWEKTKWHLTMNETDQ